MSYTLASHFACRDCGVSIRHTDRFCRQCGERIMWSSGSSNAAPDRPANEVSTYPLIPAGPQTGLAPPSVVTTQAITGPPDSLVNPVSHPVSNYSAASELLRNRWFVIAVVLCVGPIGLPVLWFSPRFSLFTKVITSVFYFGITIVLPLAIMFYCFQAATSPLLDVFPAPPE